MKGGCKLKRNTYVILVILLVLFSCKALANTDELILLDDPEIVRNALQRPYELMLIDLRLPAEEFPILNEKAQDKLVNLVSLYGNRETEQGTKSRDIEIPEYTYENLYIADNGNANRLSLNPLPGVLLDAEYDKTEEDDTVEENTNISLSYWMNNRTILRAEYGRENKEWWSIANEEINDNPILYNEEISETGRLGISYQSNKYLTFSADYINNDFPALDRDYSTIFGVEYKDVLGSVRYHYQLDYGEENSKATGLELAYKDLATFNATYKIYNRKELEEQLSHQWDFGLDLNINDISTLSLEYQVKPLIDDIMTEEDDNESNIKAQLEIKF